VLAAHNEALLHHALWGGTGCLSASVDPAADALAGELPVAPPGDSSGARTALGDPIVVLYSYTYDANGNTLSKSDGTDSNTYVYDFENRLLLADVALPGGANPPGAVTYAYDADGVRKSKSTEGVFTEYLAGKNRCAVKKAAEFFSAEAYCFLGLRVPQTSNVK